MNTPWENPVKKRLQEGLPVVAATITVANPDVAAHTATLGFDFLWIEMEHSPITLETLRNIVLAWVLTLPVCVILGSITFSGALYVAFHVFGMK